MLFPAGLREGTGALVGTKQVVGQEAQEGECRGHPGTQGSQACSCGSTGEPALVVTGLSFISGVEQVFMQESDTSNFLKKHGKRSPKSRDKVNGTDAGSLLLAYPCHSFSLSCCQLGCGHHEGPRA